MSAGNPPMSTPPNGSSGAVWRRLTEPLTQAFGRLAGVGVLVLVIAAGSVGGAVTSAAFKDPAANATNTFSAAADFGSSVTATAIGNSVGCASGRVKQGGTYYIYADAIGNPPSVTANVSGITTGQTSVPLTAGSYTAGGQTYNYRSAALTANASLPEGPISYTVSAADVATGSVTIDNTPPTAIDFQATNRPGGAVGRVEEGDVIEYTFSEPVDTCSVLPTWTGGTAAVAVVLIQAGNNDRLQIWDAATVTQLPLGSVDTNGDPVSENSWWLASSMVQTGSKITITVGYVGEAHLKTDTRTAPSVWTPSALAFDRATHPLSTATATESGALDVNF